MIDTISSEDGLAAAVRALTAAEPRFAAITARHGLPPLRLVAPGLATLCKIITEQAISLTAADRIWQRLEARFPGFAAAGLAASSEAELMALGLSGGKARGFRALAAAVGNGQCPLGDFASLGDDAVRAHLTAIPGIGDWTADVYLLAALGRSDVWPVGDIALQEAARDLFGLEARPGGKAMGALAEPWRPWRAAAARLLWSHYRHLRRLPRSAA